MDLLIKPTSKLTGTIKVPGDKSVSHRAVILGSIASGTTEVTGFLQSQDCLSTVACMEALGVPIRREGSRVIIEGRGLYGLQEPADILHVGNSGTTIRLLTGLLAGQPFTSFLTGDESIRRRPMGRVTEPLTMMGAAIAGRQGARLAPLAIRGGSLRAISYDSPVASAQVKSAVLLAGLYAEGIIEYTEPACSRDHTELMLEAFGASLKKEGRKILLVGGSQLKGGKVQVPGDLSSAAFFIVAGLIMEEGRIVLESVGLNPTRTGLLEVLQAMGGRIRIFDRHRIAGEEVGSLEIEPSRLQGISVGGDLIPRLIDEIPILAVAALFASGVTEIRDAQELKVKESNRIAAVCQGLQRLGARVSELPDGLRLEGGYPLLGSTCDSFGDHRIAMALAIAGLRAQGQTCIRGAEAVAISFPEFEEILLRLSGADKRDGA